MGKPRARDLGIIIGRLSPGPLNAITDVAGVAVGHVTLIRGDGPLTVGSGPVRTGVTVILPHDGHPGREPLFAASHVLNGDGEMTGLGWIEDSGCLTTPIAFTNTCSVGVVRDALTAYDTRQGTLDSAPLWSLPVVGETWDGFLNDIQGQHVRPEHLFQAMDDARGGPVAEGAVGGGTGMIAHGFKGGIGTASRRTANGFTVGVLVQANYGQRALLTIDGVPVGRELGAEAVPLPWTPPPEEGGGSILVVLATDAPLLPGQCRRVAQRATLGIARMGGLGENSSGDLFLAFSTANRGQPLMHGGDVRAAITAIPNDAISPLFEAARDATEEAILNALCAAETMTGIGGRRVHGLPLDELTRVMKKYGRL